MVQVSQLVREKDWKSLCQWFDSTSKRENDYKMFKEIVFLCGWVEETINVGYKVDDLGLTIINLSRTCQKYDHFILTLHAKQVYYVHNPIDTRWSVMLTFPQKGFYHGNIEMEYDVLNTSSNIKRFITHVPNLNLGSNNEDDNSSMFFHKVINGTYIYKEYIKKK